jgi:transposase
MHTHFISHLLDLPGIQITSVQQETDGLICQVQPNDVVQACPTCRSAASVIRRGTAYIRKVRHLPVFGYDVFLHLPAIRLSCHGCGSSFVWQYEGVAPKKRYTKAFEQQVSSVLGSTIQHMARVLRMPITSLTRLCHQWMRQESARVQNECWEEAASSPKLVLGIDDFAIRKAHTYNTGLHDLRGESLLEVIPGRTVEELHQYIDQHPEWGALQPQAVVLDLAPGYHRFVKEVYPGAIRIADRYHVNRYVTEALHAIRKDVQKQLASHAKKHLKRRHRLLGKRRDHLTKAEANECSVLLSYSSLLYQAYEWKETFIDWYDCSASYTLAQKGFQFWLQAGEKIDHPAIRSCLRTMNNWEAEICNYHQLRFTNAAVEGKNNKIKALQRRHYFTRNPEGYKQRLLLECNDKRVQY